MESSNSAGDARKMRNTNRSENGEKWLTKITTTNATNWQLPPKPKRMYPQIFALVNSINNNKKCVHSIYGAYNNDIAGNCLLYVMGSRYTRAVRTRFENGIQHSHITILSPKEITPNGHLSVRSTRKITYRTVCSRKLFSSESMCMRWVLNV